MWTGRGGATGRSRIPTGAAHALRRLRFGALFGVRRRIEDGHRILEAGCKVEHLGHQTAERIERAVTTVIA